MSNDSAAISERLLRHERRIVGGALLGVTLLAWVYTLAGAGTGMSAVDMTFGDTAGGMSGMAGATWTAGHALLIFLMWWVMMVAMMVPSAAPTVLLYAALNRRRAAPTAAGIFLAGYLACWATFSALATGLQWGLAAAGALTPLMAVASPRLAGAILIAAGLYQLTPLKNACLKHCRNPVEFLAAHMPRSAAGGGLAAPFRMGLRHGTFCLGCCWFLMGLLFAGGIMNVWWIAGLAIYVAIEKFGPALLGPRHGTWLAPAAGALLIAAGVWRLTTA